MSPEQDLHGTLGAHHSNLAGGPRQVDVTPQVLHGNGWRQQQQLAIKRGAPRAKSQGDMP